MRVWLVAISLLIAGCGGGGGGSSSNGSGSGSSGGTSNDGNFSLNFQPGQLNFKTDEGAHEDLKVLAHYQGQTPSGNIYVVVTLPNAFEDFYYSLRENYAELFFIVNSALEPGVYQGNVNIDVCYDAQCRSKAGNTNVLRYSLTVNQTAPLFQFESGNPYITEIYGYYSGQDGVTGFYIETEWREPSDPVTVTVTPPTGYPQITLSDDLLDTYQAEVLGPTQFILYPPVIGRGSLSEYYSIEFSNDNDSVAFDLEIVQYNRSRTPDELILEHDIVVISDNHSRFDRESRVNLRSWPEDTQTRSIDYDYVTGSSWLTVNQSSEFDTYLTVGVNPDDDTPGLREATVHVDAEGEDQAQLKVYSLNTFTQLVDRDGTLDVTGSTTAEDLAASAGFWLNTDEEVEFTPLVPWITNIQKGLYLGDRQHYKFEVDIEELDDVSIPYGSGEVYGYIKVQSVATPSIVDAVRITLELDLPDVYYITPSVVNSGSEFELTTYNDFAGSDLIATVFIKRADDNSEGLGESHTIYTGSIDTQPNYGSIFTFIMPALEPGIYTLNFAGVMGSHYKTLTLTVE